MKRRFLLIIVLACCLAARGLAQQHRLAAPTTPSALLKQIEAGTQEVRGLAFKHPVTYKTMTREEFLPWVKKQLYEQYSPEDLRRMGRAWAFMGLLPEGMDLEKEFLSLMGQEALAFYDHKTKSLYTFSDMPMPPMQAWMIVSHELTHALQDQHFDFGNFPEMKLKDNDDRQLAFQSLLEGDAVTVMPKAMAKGGMPNLPFDVGIPTKWGKDAFLQNQLVFPYKAGSKFCGALYARTSSFELINKAYRDLPKSTEQILHPEKYFDKSKRDDPKEVTLPALKSPNWRLVENNVVGEFAIRELITMHLGAAEAGRAELCAAGWGGDRFNLYAFTGGRAAAGSEPLAVWWVTVWDTPEDAVEFADAICRVFQSRFAGLTVNETPAGSGNLLLENKNWRIRISYKADKVVVVHAPAAHFREFANLVDKAAK